MARYFVGVGLPQKEGRLFDKVKQEFHPAKRLTSPTHVTLVNPFWWENEVVLLNKLRKLARQFKVFETIFWRVGSFRQPKYGTVFLEPERGKEFKQMATKLQEKLLKKKERGEYVPHLTVAQKVPHEELKKVKDQIRQMGLRLSLKVKSVVLYKMKEGKWLKYVEMAIGT